ncbi:MAG: GGDEF-domain containing protein [Actinobacteria bacterium 13_2_20CM_2_71_6]|nr:MAG: GGDEF-domain containing protein [Actinobacteria bacterium 13_2_20CM_2_71_6]
MEGTALGSGAPPGRERVFFGYVAVVCVLALTLTAPYLAGLPAFLHHAPLGFWLMAGLALLADVGAAETGLSGRRPLGPVYPSLCFGFATLLIWGIGPAVLAQSLAVAVASLRQRYRPWRAVFHAGQHALALVVAHLVAGGAAGPAGTVAAAAGWLAVHHGIVGTALWLRSGTGRWRPLGGTAPDELLSTVALLALAPLLAAAAYRSPAWIPLVLAPLYAVQRMARLSRAYERQVRLDPLTGLLGRRALETGLAARVREGGRFALFLLDLDRFKQVNDALGHDVGDRLLIAVGERLAGTVPRADLVARLGGDEFAIVTGEPASALDIAQALTEPVVLDRLPLDVSGAIGVAAYPDHGTDAATLLRHAEVAMYDAKSRGDAVAPYTAESDHNSPERLSLLADLRRALEAAGTPAAPGGGITFYYQPQVDIGSGEVIGVEALLRWHHPERGPVDPEELIRVAEHSTVMRLLTRRVVDDVVAQLAQWAMTGVRVRASINVSVRDLHTSEVADRLADRLRYHGVGADQVQLEITEGALMADPRRVLATLRRLDTLGIALSLDDFGTGYSSMQHLRRLPLSEVKIDRSFVLGMAGDPDDEAIVRSIIELAGALGLRVVAEGVEDERTFRMLAASGCHAAQGWFLGRPMPADELLCWLARYRPPQRLIPAWPPAPAY